MFTTNTFDCKLSASLYLNTYEMDLDMTNNIIQAHVLVF